jgi:hypothetical protein
MRMRLALIPPTVMMEHTLLTDVQMVLAPQYLNSDGYREEVNRLHKQGPSYIILDNGACEGQLLSMHDLQDAALELHPTELVLPDVLGDYEQTVELVRSWPRKLLSQDVRLMAVLQGQTWEEFSKCLLAYAELPYIYSIGIPRHMPATLDDPMARVNTANFIFRNYGRRWPLHALGANTAYPTEASFLHHAKFRSIDTSLPYTFAFANRMVDHFVPELQLEKIDRPENYFSLTPVKAIHERALRNVGAYMALAYGEYA